MKKKILMAVDDSIHSHHSMRYAIQILSESQDVTFTLFHVQPIISQYLLDEARTDSKANATLKKTIKKTTVEAQMLLEKQKERMITMGIADERIEMLTQPRMLGLARDILEYARKGIYDAIVVGRRGLSRIQKTFMGSTSANLLEGAEATPVWMVDGNVTSQRVLVAVDGSESSYRALSHVELMLSGNPEIKYSLLHVSGEVKDIDAISLGKDDPVVKDLFTKGSERLIGTFFADAEQKLKEAGIADSQVEFIRSKRRAKVGKMILEEANQRDCGTVVVGRRGADRSHFFGSVSRYVTERITDRALWLIP